MSIIRAKTETSTIPSADDIVGEEEASITAGGNVGWPWPFGRQVGGFLES